MGESQKGNVKNSKCSQHGNYPQKDTDLKSCIELLGEQRQICTNKLMGVPANDSLRLRNFSCQFDKA